MVARGRSAVCGGREEEERRRRRRRRRRRGTVIREGKSSARPRTQDVVGRVE